MKNKKLPAIITLPNRDHLKVELILLNENEMTYTLCMDNASYIRFCQNTDIDDPNYKHYHFIDPNGGPFISIGDDNIFYDYDLIIKDIKIKTPIQADYKPIITLEKLKS